MDRIGSLLQPPPHSEGAEFLAAAIVATANEYLQELFHFTPLEASAKSIRDGTLMIETEHGAVAGTIMHRADELSAKINEAIARRFNRTRQVLRVVTRRR